MSECVLYNNISGYVFPNTWKEEKIGIAKENIVKNSPISAKIINDWSLGQQRLANPNILPSDMGQDCSITQDGLYLAVINQITAPFIVIYKRSGETFIKLEDPIIPIAGIGSSCSFSPDGIYLAVSHDVTPYITIYKRNGDTFAKLTNPSILPTGYGYDCAFSPDGIYLAVGHYTAPNITIYKPNSKTFVTLLKDYGNIPYASEKKNNIGFALDSVEAGEPIIINTFPILSSLIR